MARALYYPPASQTAQWFQNAYSGSPIAPNVLVWHTTETGGWPGYDGGASAPHLTYHAEDHDWRQHFRLDRSSRALRNASGGVETNTLNACQVEIIAYSDESLARSRGHLPVSELDARALRELGEFARFMWDEWGLKLDIDPGWVRSNYVTAPPMSFAQWRGFYGHTGHNRVPENTHWDPAALDIDTIIGHAKGDDDVRPSEWTAADRKAVCEAVWSTDGVIPSIDPDGTNPHWHAKTWLTRIGGALLKSINRVDSTADDAPPISLRQMWAYTHAWGVRNNALMRAQQPLLEAAAQGQGMTPEQVAQVAAACAAAVPDTLAEDVVDELVDRLDDDA